MRARKISARRVFKTQTYSNPSLWQTRKKGKEKAKSSADGAIENTRRRRPGTRNNN